MLSLHCRARPHERMQHWRLRGGCAIREQARVTCAATIGKNDEPAQLVRRPCGPITCPLVSLPAPSAILPARVAAPGRERSTPAAPRQTERPPPTAREGR